MNLFTWARKYNVPLQAIGELQDIVGLNGTPGNLDNFGKSESFVESQLKLEAAQKGVRLWRNNVGVLEDKNGRPVRYGLANESPQMNKIIKSCDYIGVRPVTITSAHIGLTIGQFVGRETKKPGWKFTGSERENAQLTYCNLVNSMGGDAGFVTGPGTL